MPVTLPPFDLQASAQTLGRLTSGITGWYVEATGRCASQVWLRTADGATWLVYVEQRDVGERFEVFSLGMLSETALRDRWERWAPPAYPEEMPDALRQLLMVRPPAPAAPAAFEPWPLRSWRTEVIVRAEFIVEDIAAADATFGSHPNWQSAARPREVPAEAAAACDVAAGLLFTGEGRRLLLAVDWMPMTMLVTQDAPAIEAFLSQGELVDMADYLRRRDG